MVYYIQDQAILIREEVLEMFGDGYGGAVFID